MVALKHSPTEPIFEHSSSDYAKALGSSYSRSEARSQRRRLHLGFLNAGLMFFSLYLILKYLGRPKELSKLALSLCPQVEPVTPHAHVELLQTIESAFELDTYKQWAIENLRGSVRIPYVTLY